MITLIEFPFKVCYNLHMKSKDLTNQKFGKLLVVEKACTKNGKVYWKCLCNCGKTTYATTSNLRCNKIKSCGCVKNEILVKRSTKHNQRNTKLYEVWKSIKQRCLNPNNKAFVNYGKRGILICEDWKNDFINFYNWSIKNGYSEGLSIDRINVDGNYEPSNCRWTTRIVQANNTRTNRYITIDNETKSLADWCRHFNISYSLVYQREKKYKWDIIKALTTPPKQI